MGATERTSYEVQAMRDGRWVMTSIFDAEDQARAAATKLLADKKCEGARVVRNWNRQDGRMVESEIFCQTRTVRDDGPVRIVPIETAPPRCERTEDYYGVDSRMVMSRIFHNYFEKAYVTPTEVIHNFRELKRIQDKDSLVPSAVDRVASLQTRQSGGDSKARRDEIFKTLEQMSQRARRAEQNGLPKLGGHLSQCFGELRAPDAADRDFLALAVLSRELINTRNWLGKLERLCALAAAEPDPHAVTLLDGVIADVLGADVVQEILGWQPSLGQAIRSMLDLADGRLAADKSPSGEPAELLNRLLAEGKLPTSRLCLIDRAHRQLRSANPLRRSEPSKELEEYKAVVARMATPRGLYDGPNTADALTTRYSRMVEQGGDAGKRAAIAATFRAMPDRAWGVIYLCELARTAYAKGFAADMVEQFHITLCTRRLGDLCPPSLPPKERMARATAAHAAMLASPFPAKVKEQVAGHIDGLLERYLIDEQIVEKLDHAGSPLRDRAIRLVQFCAAGVLPEGRALTRARQRILALLRQPNFDEHFVQGIPSPEAGQAALRQFHQLLVKAGFG